MIVHDLYSSCAHFCCFDGGAGDGGAQNTGDGAGAGAGAGDAGGSAGAGAGDAGGQGESKTFTQEQLNKILAEDRRKHQAALVKTEQTYKELLANSQSLTAKERATLEENLATVQGQLRTKEQQAQIEKKELEDRYQAKVGEAEKKAQDWESRYRESTVSRSLQDAAISADAFNPSQVVALLRPLTKLIEVVDEKTGRPTGQFRTIVEFPDTDATTGESIVTSRTPEEAVKRMQELPEVYGNLFKRNVVGGIGANSAVAGIAGTGGKIDVRNLTPQQYRDIRAKNPELLGLRAKGRRS